MNSATSTKYDLNKLNKKITKSKTDKIRWREVYYARWEEEKRRSDEEWTKWEEAFDAKWEEDKRRDEERWQKWEEDDKMYWEKEFEKDRHNLKKEEDKLKKMEEKLKQVKLKHEKRKQEKKKQKIREEEKKRQQERLKWKKQDDERRRKAEEIKERQQDDERRITDQMKPMQLDEERIQIDNLKQWKLELEERLNPSTKKTNTDCCERRGCDEELDIKFMHHTDKQSGNQDKYNMQVSEEKLDDKDESKTCKSKQQIKVYEKAKIKESFKVIESNHQIYRIGLEDMNDLTEQVCVQQNIIQDTEDNKAINKPSEQSTEHKIRMNQPIECVKVKDEQEIKSELEDHKLKQTVITKRCETELASYDNKMIINEKHNEVTDNQIKYENEMIGTEMQHYADTQDDTECDVRNMQTNQNLTEHGNKETQTCNDKNDSTNKTRDDTYEFAATEVNIEETLMNNEEDDDLEMINSTSDTMPDKNTQMETNSNDVTDKEQVIIPKLSIPNIQKGGKLMQGNKDMKIQRKMKSKYQDSKEKYLDRDETTKETWINAEPQTVIFISYKELLQGTTLSVTVSAVCLCR